MFKNVNAVQKYLPKEIFILMKKIPLTNLKGYINNNKIMCCP